MHVFGFHTSADVVEKHSWFWEASTGLQAWFASRPGTQGFLASHSCLCLQGATPEDFSNLPPEQRRKKLQQKVDELNKEIQKETDQR